ncbi:hypothetical protein PTSG_07679 [Salpingoeca rosetta]|uniref:Complex III subunit 9 n=1 Tax=Salpingoeca rosetta (strain ATCC 50818 / BSB-021) TaxID=946362 RepID=F2UHG5_SALR5|nr:uncharacterized protein PTSG_07679 [Salpingoeca rosetta]EGD76564.1 hypothetical protein PTSG_07679 [Salpingoeca rosetta]|eukprot:XP_004991478.1 hypothetical protein PTSG_07679 [Salpingoeca rosetta]
MSFAKTMYQTVFRRQSTTLVFIFGGCFVFERIFNPLTDGYFQSRNAGKLYSDLPCSKEE